MLMDEHLFIFYTKLTIWVKEILAHILHIFNLSIQLLNPRSLIDFFFITFTALTLTDIYFEFLLHKKWFDFLWEISFSKVHAFDNFNRSISNGTTFLIWIICWEIKSAFFESFKKGFSLKSLCSKQSLGQVLRNVIWQMLL